MGGALAVAQGLRFPRRCPGDSRVSGLAGLAPPAIAAAVRCLPAEAWQHQRLAAAASSRQPRVCQYKPAA